MVLGEKVVFAIEWKLLTNPNVIPPGAIPNNFIKFVF